MSHNSVGILISISFRDLLLINIHESTEYFNKKAACTTITMHVKLMEQPRWLWIGFDFCVRFTSYLD